MWLFWSRYGRRNYATMDVGFKVLYMFKPLPMSQITPCCLHIKMQDSSSSTMSAFTPPCCIMITDLRKCKSPQLNAVRVTVVKVSLHNNRSPRTDCNKRCVPIWRNDSLLVRYLPQNYKRLSSDPSIHTKAGYDRTGL